MKNNRINLSANECFKPFDRSFNRVKYFSCITDNLDVSHIPDDWTIKNETGLSYAVNEPEEKKKEYLIKSYKHFIQCYLVRDCIESFALCLDKLFFVLLLIGKTVPSDQTLYGSLSDENKELLKTFKNKGLYGRDGKIKLLKRHFNLELSEPYKKIISDLKDIRDCLSHGNGIVSDRYGKQDEQGDQKFHWATLTIFGVGVKSGERVKIEIGKPPKEETDIYIKPDTRDHFKSFKAGEMLSFSSAETYEIALSLQLVAQEYLKKIQKMYITEEHLKKTG